MVNSRNKRFICFKLYGVLHSMMKACAILFWPTLYILPAEYSSGLTDGLLWGDRTCIQVIFILLHHDSHRVMLASQTLQRESVEVSFQ